MSTRDSAIPALTICPKNGSIRISGNPAVLAGGMAQDQAVAALATLFCSSVDHKNGYEWFTYGGVSFGGEPCGFGLCFHEGRLTQLSFGVSLPGTKLEGGWPTQEAIDEEIAFVRRELARQLDRPFRSGEERFPWGVAWSQFDPKGFQASAGVRYDTHA